jgi:hypothetical protein
MAWIQKTEGLISFIQQGRMGRPMLCGQAMCGWSQCGEEIEQAGVYQNRRVRQGNWSWYGKITGKTKICKMLHTWPVYPNTPSQQTSNNKFASAVAGWQSLTSEQKSVYNERAKGKVLSGYNLYISEYMYG